MSVNLRPPFDITAFANNFLHSSNHDSIPLMSMKINVAIDIGNSSHKVGFFEDDQLINTVIVESQDMIEALNQHEIEGVVLSSVKNLSKELLDLLLKTYKQVLVVDSQTPMPIQVNYDTPQTLGADRLAAAVGARTKTKGNVLIIDIGTCITYDLLTADATFQGGIISPGLKLRLRAMHEFTDQLPLVSLPIEVPLVGKSTETCMQSGALNGTLAEISQIIHDYNQQIEDLTVIICGGDAVYFENKFEMDTFVVPNLVLEGLNSILRFNAVV
jgi:type III pantothenate kinase